MKFNFLIFIALFGFSIHSFCNSSQDNNVEGGLLGEYFNSISFEHKVFTRIDKELNFYYKNTSPAPGVNHDNYSIRWSGRILAPVTGEYEFIARVDDGIRVWIDGENIINNWSIHEAISLSGEIELTGGKYYDIKVEYFNGPNECVMELYWKSPQDRRTTFFGLIDDTPQKIIPSKYLSPKIPEPEFKPLRQNIRPEKTAPIETTSKKSTDKSSSPKKITSEKTKPKEEEVFTKLERGKTINLSTVLFKQSTYILLDQSYPELQKLLRTMEKHPDLHILISGHTDNKGDPRLNQILSLQRAQVVAAYLVQNGIEEIRLETIGQGDSQPIADNSIPSQRIKNRRVEFIVK